MYRFIVRRLVYMVMALLATTMIVFGLSRVQGDPRTLYIQEGGYGMTRETWEAVGRELGLDKPLVVQYAIWLGRTLKGDMGHSLRSRQPVTEAIQQRIGPTVRLGLVSWILATLVGIPLGVLSAMKRGSMLDLGARVFALLGQAAPTFWIAIMAILVFAVHFRWLPVGTMGDGTFSIRHFIMPAITLGLFSTAGYLRLTRSSMLEVLDSEYVKLARAKGVSGSSVIWKHAFRNALIGPLTVSTVMLSGFVTGAVVVEVVFSWPGLGRLAVDSVANNDFPLMTGVVLVFAAIYLVANFLTDLAYAFIDPRIRYS